MSWLGRLGAWTLNKTKLTAISVAKKGVPLVGGFYLYLYVDRTYGGLTLVKGPSMQPTFNYHLTDGWQTEGAGGSARDVNNNEDLVYYTRNFKLARGDVVILKEPNSDTLRAKRLVGIPGDTVTPLGFNQQPREPVTIGEGQVWVESDKAGWGYRDSSVFGPVSDTLVTAKVTFVLGNLRQFHVKWKEVEARLPEHTRGRLVQGEGQGEEQGEVQVQVVQEVQGKVLVQ